eukprot:TRINITY_DN5807_c1_g1_i4.p4 TRINITY_DN5807_c1_g1~~TRINITY_DN5807_c1_g1_i4.p4  ORF type:complete len:107 (-),score=7.67 TRINITY_DN5807_c1_g1_i4:346-666(-)
MSVLYPQPIPGLDIKAPIVTPQPGQQIIGYERVKYEAACCDCQGLTSTGFACVIILVIVCWPLAFIPCLNEDCREEYQRPVYGNPGSAPSASAPGYMPPVAVPVVP